MSAAATHYRMMKNAGRADEFTFHFKKLSYTGEPIDPATITDRAGILSAIGKAEEAGKLIARAAHRTGQGDRGEERRADRE